MTVDPKQSSERHRSVDEGDLKMLEGPEGTDEMEGDLEGRADIDPKLMEKFDL